MTKAERDQAKTEARAALVAAVRKPTPEFGDWGVMRVRAWERVIKKARPCLKRNARLTTLTRHLASIRAVGAMPVDQLVDAQVAA